MAENQANSQQNCCLPAACFHRAQYGYAAFLDGAGVIQTRWGNLSYPPTLIPETWTLKHYKVLFTMTSFPIWFRNSLFVAVGTTISAIMISSMGAYVFSRFRYRFFEIFSRVILFAYMVPTVLLIIPVFIIVHSLKLSNTLYGLILVYNAFHIPYGLWTLRSYFSGIPHEIEEASLHRWLQPLASFH